MRSLSKYLKGGLVALIFFAGALPALADDTTRPFVGAPSPGEATAGVPVTILASVSDDDSGIASCNLYVDNDDAGAMNVSGTLASVSYTFAQVGIHTIFVFCRDNANNFYSGSNTSVTVSSPSGRRSLPPPTVSQISPLTATAGVSVTLGVSVSDAVGCTLFVNGFSAGPMTLGPGISSWSYTFSAPGSYLVYAQCFNQAGISVSGPEGTAVVSAQVVAQPQLIKTPCLVGAAADHPCKAIYYRGTDGKRHAFPNSKVYFTWYADFSGVEEVSLAEMADAPLGKQVTYRPGSKLVKFTTVNNVYAVAKGGTLRWVKSEEVASALYGADWNTKVDDISDAFYLDYTFGTDINTADDFSPPAEAAASPTIE